VEEYRYATVALLVTFEPEAQHQRREAPSNKLVRDVDFGRRDSRRPRIDGFSAAVMLLDQMRYERA
jgi:hypothetical protein